MYWWYSLAAWSTLLAADVDVWAAPLIKSGKPTDHRVTIPAIFTRSAAVNQTTAPLPDTFATSDASTLPSRQYTLTYSHDQIEMQPSISLIALHFGAANLSQALDAAIDDATNQARSGSQQPQTHLHASFNHLSLIVTPAADVQQPLSLTWTDFATILQILRKDLLQRRNPSKLFVGVVGDTSGNVYAQVAVLPEVVFVSQAATINPVVNNLNGTVLTQSTFIGNPGRGLQWDPARNGDNPSSSDDANIWDQDSNSEMESAERESGVTREGPPIRGTNLTMLVNESHGRRIAADRLREAYESVRDSVAVLPRGDPSARISGSITSPTIALRRPGHGISAEFGTVDLRYYHRDESQLTSREMYAVFAALDVVMNQFVSVAFPPSIEIYRVGVNPMIAYFYFWQQSNEDPLSVTGPGNNLIANPVASGSSAERVRPQPPGASSNSATTGNYVRPTNQPSSSIPDSGTWDSISQRLQASNRRVCSWWTTCFTGSWPQP